jgi:pyruvate, orthophosphate dikinase
MADRHVYGFGGGAAEGEGLGKDLLGGKGYGLAEMSRLGVPVPPGLTITTAVCTWFQDHGGTYPDTLRDEVAAQLAAVEERLGQRFGDPADPLLLSVRSGAPLSMPGMMDTILNLGLNDEIVAVQLKKTDNPQFVLDAYRRLLSMYGDVVLGVARDEFEGVLKAARTKQGVATDAELSREALGEVCCKFAGLISGHGKVFPQDPQEQLWGAIGAVFESWNNQRARDYRRLNDIPDHLGTAVNVQAMVFGNRGPDCATGVAFTRHPGTGDGRVFGEYLINAQGEDVVAGIRTPREITPADGGPGLEAEFPAAAAELQEVCRRLERHFRDMQDVEFTIQHGRLFMLQTRTGKRTGLAALRIAVEMLEAGLIDEREALKRVEPQHLEQLLAPIFDLDEKKQAVGEGRLLGRGLPAGPGAAAGRIALTAERAAEMAADGSGPVLLVRAETSPEDIVGMHAAAGILTSRGGMTSHAAVVARGMGKPCVVGAGDLEVDEHAGEVRAAGRVLREGDDLSIDGSTGEVIAGALESHPSEVVQVVIEGRSGDDSAAVRLFRTLFKAADAERRLRVRANADTPHDARVARAFGAEGIGLCRTEHMFFEEDRIPWVRRMILAGSDGERREALARLLPMQQGDFEGIFTAMAGLPVTVRLLDPPLHEFLPHGEARQHLADQMGVELAEITARAEALAETNPMLGHRGCRLGLTHPEIYDMQVEAIARAAVACQRRGVDVRPEIMVPLVGSEREMVQLRKRTETVVERVFEELGERVQPLLIGTMIEVPRAALVAGRIARHADFFSFGTNDLTQMTYGFSRDDAGKFLPAYLEQDILDHDPFACIDEQGVGQLVALACEKGRAEKPHLHLGVCGEHGGDPKSIHFFEKTGLDYVSCSPYRVPIARLAAARARLGVGAGGKDTS